VPLTAGGGVDLGSPGHPASEADVTNLVADLASRAKVDLNSPAFTLHVDRSQGNDSNSGDSLGNALQTLEAAINKLQQAGTGGKILMNGVSPGPFNIAATMHLVNPFTIECLGPGTVTIFRNFGTPNGRSVWDAVTTAAGTSVQSATAAFAAGDVNRIVSIYGAGSGGGTYYGFISAVPDSTHATIPATAVARNSTTDPRGVKMTICGDWDRVVTDAAITSGQSVITSAAAAFTQADVGREVVIAGAGRSGQALRTAIRSVSGNTATVQGTASATVSGARCAIGVNFGNLFMVHGGNGNGGSVALKNVTLSDASSGAGRIGSPLAIYVDDCGSGGASPSPSDLVFDDLRFTSTDAAGAWEHNLDVDGSWNQVSGGPGCRRATFDGIKPFGTRAVGENIRLNSAVHYNIRGIGQFMAPTAIAQGIVILDPQKSAGIQRGTADVHFAAYEASESYLYCEGQHCTFMGGWVAAVVAATGRRAIELSQWSDGCAVFTSNASTLTGLNADEYNAGTNNVIETNVGSRLNARRAEATILSGLKVETIARANAPILDVNRGSSGALVLMALWLPGGMSLTKVALHGGATPLAWGTGWTGQHFIFGVYDADGNLYGQTNDTGGTEAFSNSFTTRTITKDGAGAAAAAVRVPRSGLNFIGLLVSSGTGGSGFTYPNFGGLTCNIAGTAPPLCGVTGSGLTALPTSLSLVSGGVPGGVGSLIYGGVG
jgi:hypothetical protein